MLTFPPRISFGTLLILLPALALGTILLSSCGSHATNLQLRFGIDGDTATAKAVQFYVHAIELIDEHGTPHPFRLTEAPPWQGEHVALLDLAGDPATPRRFEVEGAVEGEVAKYAGIRLTFGVPFELNHSNPLTAAAPLDRGDLFWTWQTGHKFLRADLAIDGREWSFHVGSTGCSSASALRPPEQPCAQPNQMRIELQGDPSQQVIRLRLAPLIAAARAADYVACTGDYEHDPACREGYAATGLQPGVAQSLWVLQ
jgi:uncharacterized repeat protein (TIGR04052 family)